MLEVSVSRCCALVLVLVFAAAQENAKRQVHNPHAPHTPLPSKSLDPLATWMASAALTRPNVLFLVADDLRPQLGCYGDSNMVTPNIDHLAHKSVMFEQAFCQMAVCGPSRASFLTGRRPDTTGVFDQTTYFRTSGGNFTTLPQFFKQHGYHSQGVGKIFHQAQSTNDEQYSWSSDSHSGVDPLPRPQPSVRGVNETLTGKLRDTDIADFAVNFLEEHAHNRDQPFFLAVGFRKTHLPWIFPQEYLDLYPLSNISLAQHRTVPLDTPDIAWGEWHEIGQYRDVQNYLSIGGLIADDYHATLRQYFSATVSYVDALLGRVLQALTQNGFAENTIVAFMSDHGYQLGENAQWCKQNNFDLSVRIPMMLHVPGVTAAPGGHFGFFNPLAHTPGANVPGPLHATGELVEALDMYPTLAELSGLPVPPTCPPNSENVVVCTEGTSLVPLIEKVRGIGDTSNMVWKQAAFSQYRQRYDGGDHSIMGYSVRTATHRYTEWVHHDSSVPQPDFSQVMDRELYDHTNDQFEFFNLAERRAYISKVAELSRILHAGWRQTLDDYVHTPSH